MDLIVRHLSLNNGCVLRPDKSIPKRLSSESSSSLTMVLADLFNRSTLVRGFYN